MTYFQDTIFFLEQIGVLSVFLPFFLVFVVVFAVMQKAKPFGEDSKKFNVIVALVMGLAVVFPHFIDRGGPYDVVPIINNALPHVSIVLVAIIMLLLLLGVMGSSFTAKGPYGGLVLLAAVGGIIYIFLGASQQYYGLPQWLDNPQTIGIVVTLLVFGVVISFITSDGKDPDKKSVLQNLNDHLNGQKEK